MHKVFNKCQYYCSSNVVNSNMNDKRKFSNELTGSFTNAKDTAPIKGRVSISGFNSTLNKPLSLILRIPADTPPMETLMSQSPSYLRKIIEKQILAVCMSQAAANNKN